MTKEELKVGNWVYRINNFTGLPLEIIYVVSELKDWSLKYNEIDFPEVEESEIPYSDLVPVTLTEDILKKLGFVILKETQASKTMQVSSYIVTVKCNSPLMEKLCINLF